MDAADPRIDYLSGTDCNGNDILYGILKKRGASKRVPLFFYWYLQRHSQYLLEAFLILSAR
jgi:hypothetical protein